MPITKYSPPLYLKRVFVFQKRGPLRFANPVLGISINFKLGCFAFVASLLKQIFIVHRYLILHGT